MHGVSKNKMVISNFLYYFWKFVFLKKPMKESIHHCPMWHYRQLANSYENYQERLAIPHIDRFQPNKQKTKFFHLLKVFAHSLRLNTKKINY